MRENILLAVRRSEFSEAFMQLFLENGYRIYVTDNEQEAWTLVKNEKVGLIVADVNMTLSKGIKLLSSIKEDFPDVIRVVSGTIVDEKQMMNALQQNLAKAFIYKPFEEEKLLKLVNQLVEADNRLKKSGLLSLIINTQELPTIKTSYQRILNLIDNDRDMNEIAAAIESDQSITAKVLRIANSAFYGARTGSIKQAATYLGLRNIRDLVLSTSIFDLFHADGMLLQGFQPIWEHAFASSKLVQIIYRIMKKKLPDMTTTAGLLMNIGIVFFLKCYRQQYLQMIVAAGQENKSLEEMEAEIFGASHAVVGAYLLEWWNMPFTIIESALYHHCPLDDKVINKELLCVIHIAEYYAAKLSNRPTHGALNQEALMFLGLNALDLQNRISEVI